MIGGQAWLLGIPSHIPSPNSTTTFLLPQTHHFCASIILYHSFVCTKLEVAQALSLLLLYQHLYPIVATQRLDCCIAVHDRRLILNDQPIPIPCTITKKLRSKKCSTSFPLGLVGCSHQTKWQQHRCRNLPTSTPRIVPFTELNTIITNLTRRPGVARASLLINDAPQSLRNRVNGVPLGPHQHP